MTTLPRYEQYKDTHKFFWCDVRKTLANEIMYLTPYVDEQRMKEFSNIILYIEKEAMKHPKLEWNQFIGEYQLRMTEQEMWNWLHNTLFAFKDYQNLNLSYNEREAGIDVNDENRPQFAFHTRYDINTKESWKNEFIDLDAVIQNVMSTLCPVRLKDEDTIQLKSCTFCEHYDKESNECLTCINNKKFKDNFMIISADEDEHYRKKDEKKWCEQSCTNQYDICCYSCSEKDNCENRCCKSFFTDDNTISCKGLK